MTAALPLWPHQQLSIDRAREAFAARHQRVVIQLPTGAGKSRTGAAVVHGSVARGRRVLWLAHRTELIDQAADTLEASGLAVGIVAASRRWRAAPDAPVQVASIQTLLAREAERPAADLIVADECHHLSAEGAEVWAGLIDHYSAARVLGLTATPERADGCGLAPMFTSMVQVCSVRDLTATTPGEADKPLVPCRVERPDKYLKRRGVPGVPLAQDPVDAYCDRARGTQAFLFARTVGEAEQYAARLEGAGIPARAVSQRTPAGLRTDAIAAFRAGSVRVLCNVYVFTEGTDLPMAETCILARGASTTGTFLQMVGRVLRRAPGKRDALLLDLPGVSHLWGMPEDERIWSLEGRACKLAGELELCKVCGLARRPEPPCCECALPEDERETGATEIANVPLSPYAREIAKGPIQRHETALRWAAHAALKGRKPGWVYHRYKEVYGAGMPRATWAAVKAAMQ